MQLPYTVISRVSANGSKRPWALEIHGPKNGGGRLHGEAICTYNAYTWTVGSSKMGVGAYSGEYGTIP